MKVISLGNNTDGLEVGIVVAWTLSVNPSDNYLECNGQAVDSTKYPKLYELMHNTPDYRGVFLRGLGGNSATLGELQGDAIRNITGYFGRIDDNMGDYVNGAFYLKIAKGWDWSSYATDTNSQILYFDASRVVPVAVENRPINKSVRYFIKAK
ncbi:phage tail protein [Megamonas funiformis]